MNELLNYEGLLFAAALDRTRLAQAQEEEAPLPAAIEALAEFCHRPIE